MKHLNSNLFHLPSGTDRNFLLHFTRVSSGLLLHVPLGTLRNKDFGEETVH